MYMEDAESSSTDKTLFKEVVDGTLFKEVKFYSSPEEVNHVGYIFHKSYKDGENWCITWKVQNFGLPGVILFLPGLVN